MTWRAVLSDRRTWPLIGAYVLAGGLAGFVLLELEAPFWTFYVAPVVCLPPLLLFTLWYGRRYLAGADIHREAGIDAQGSGGVGCPAPGADPPDVQDAGTHVDASPGSPRGVRAPYGHTRSGVPITDDLVERLAAEAEAGYDVDEIIERRRRADG